MENSRGSPSLSCQMAVLSMIVMFFLQIGILTSFAGDLVRRAQESMVEKGIDPGPIDGIWGPLTRGGVIEFQKREGLTVSGRLDDATKKRLFSTPESPPSDIKTATEPSAPEKSSPGVPMVPLQFLYLRWKREKFQVVALVGL